MEFKTKLWRRLSTLDVFYTHGPEQISIRCPFCGDSLRNERSAHFYIKISAQADMPILYNCFRSDCQASGILTPSLLRTLKINDLKLNSSLLSYNKKAVKTINKELGIIDNNFDVIVPKPDENSESNIKKLDYINKRLGLKLSFEELAQMRTIFSLGQFLKENYIENITVKKETAKLLQSDYVGFLTTRCEFINFRNIYDNKNRRYEKYKVYQSIENSRKFYTIPNDIDLLTTKKITINIAEGIFDIFGIYHHIFDKEKSNMIYTAVCGAGYMSVLKYFIQVGVVGDVEVNIFSDSNMAPKAYKNIIDELKPWVSNFNLYYNDIMKNGKSDYGVKKSEIKLSKRRM